MVLINAHILPIYDYEIKIKHRYTVKFLKNNFSNIERKEA